MIRILLRLFGRLSQREVDILNDLKPIKVRPEWSMDRRENWWSDSGYTKSPLEK